jgi:hypothetical protein
VGFEPAIPETKRPQTYALNRAAVGIGLVKHIVSSFRAEDSVRFSEMLHGVTTHKTNIDIFTIV